MTETGTLDHVTLEEEHYFVAVTDNASDASNELPTSATPLFQRMLNKFETVVLPVTIMAAFAAPGIGGGYCRTLGHSKATGMIVDLRYWDDDSWRYTEEMAAVAEIRALNELLALSVPEGTWIELDDE